MLLNRKESYIRHLKIATKKSKAIPFTGLDRPWVFQEVESPRFQDNRHVKVLRLSTLSNDQLYPPPPRKYSRYSFLLEVESAHWALVRPEELCQWNVPMTPSWIENATFRLVAHCLNKLHHIVPPIENCITQIKNSLKSNKFRKSVCVFANRIYGWNASSRRTICASNGRHAEVSNCELKTRIHVTSKAWSSFLT
jgi:hypothetical protein